MSRFYQVALLAVSMLALAGGIGGCSHGSIGYYGDTRGYYADTGGYYYEPAPAGYAQIEIIGSDGYHHRGYYDHDNRWHGGYYDRNHRYHNDSHDWHRR